MTSATQIQDSNPHSLRYRVQKAHPYLQKAYPYRLKHTWSYGRGYIVIAGITLVVLAGLAIVHLHQTWRQFWQRI